MKQPNFDQLEKEQTAKTFTSWKLDLIDALAIDPRLKDVDFRVAFLMLQHMNSETGMIFPSQARLAVLLAKGESTVKRAIEHLQETGWLVIDRPNKRVSNRYSFDDSRVGPMLDRRTSLEDKLREKTILEGSKVSRQKWLEGSNSSRREGSRMTPEHLKGTPELSAGNEGHRYIGAKINAA